MPGALGLGPPSLRTSLVAWEAACASQHSALPRTHSTAAASALRTQAVARPSSSLRLLLTTRHSILGGQDSDRNRLPLPSSLSLPRCFSACVRGKATSASGSRSPTAMAETVAAPAASGKPFVGDLGVRSGFVEAIGNTPLIRLNLASEETGCEIYGKAEFLNPGGSVKDRAAYYIIKDAEERGLLRPGGIIVEGTAGNTGIGLSLVANARGYRSVIVIPVTQSQEKKDMLKISGATLIEVPAVPYKNPNNYVKYSGRLAEAIAKTHPGGAIWGNQFDNVANRRAHYETTGPEIWAQTGGKVDGFICAVGTGGTLAGTGKFLKERNPNVRIGMVDPMGAALYKYYATGELGAEGSSISEGIGQGRITGNLEGWGVPAREGGVVDFWCRAGDEEALPVMYDLLKQEGLCMGLSTGINVAGAIKLAKELGPGHTIVTILCDLGTRYQGKLFNVDFLKTKGLPYPEWMDPEQQNMDVPLVFEDVEPPA